MGDARVIFTWGAQLVEREINPDQVESERERLDKAVVSAVAELGEIKKSAGRALGGPTAKIFDAQLMIAEDREFLKRVKEAIKTRLRNAEYVYSSMVDISTAPLRKSKDTYMRQMLSDIEAVSKRILRFLLGDDKRKEAPFPPNTILVALKITPAETLHYYEMGVAGLVCVEGSANSHMALIARSLYLPAVVGVSKAQNKIRNGAKLIVDGGMGKVHIEPDDSLWNSYKLRKSGEGPALVNRLSELDRFPPETTDGHEIELGANIELPGPRDKILAERGVGVGLYRTEFIYLQSNHFPNEDDQFRYYDAIAEQYAPQAVVMRTFDLGSDKYVEELQPLGENNPALGWRGIRASLDRPELFKTQMNAILRASHRGNVKVLLPMISDIEELLRAKRIIKRLMVILRRAKIEFDQSIEIGVMIEVPSAALAADQFAKEASFLSIGSNDLVQYTLAVDRDNMNVANLYRKFHPTVLKLIKMTIESAKRYNTSVSVCGEMAGDPLAVPLLIGMGIESLSMSPSKLFENSNMVSVMSLAETQKLADEALGLERCRDIEKLLAEFYMEIKARISGVVSERA